MARSSVRRFRPGVELLESRDQPSIFTVVSTADSGEGTLRWAIEQANANPNAQNPGGALDEIHFNLPAGQPFVIRPTDSLPIIQEAVRIDGWTQPGFQGTPLVVIDGSLAGEFVHGLSVHGGGTTIRGLVINGFGGVGIELLDGGDNLLLGNYVGVDPTGSVAIPNGRDDFPEGYFGGILILHSQDNLLRDNLVSGNLGFGIAVVGYAEGNDFFHNLVGVAADGLSSLGNLGNGFEFFLYEQEGMLTRVEGNIIAFNQGHGVHLGSGHSIRISENRFLGNGGLGINLERDRDFSGNNGGGPNAPPPPVTPNDPLDLDWGANRGQNFPVLTSAEVVAGRLVVSGVLDSSPLDGFWIELYAAPEADPTGHGEGWEFLGRLVVTTDELGHVSWTATVAIPPFETRFLTAIAIHQELGDTSEFSGVLAFDLPRPSGDSEESEDFDQPARPREPDLSDVPTDMGALIDPAPRSDDLQPIARFLLNEESLVMPAVVETDRPEILELAFREDRLPVGAKGTVAAVQSGTSLPDVFLPDDAVNTGKIMGLLFEDYNGNGQRDPGEPALEGRIIFLDLDGDGRLSEGEPLAVTNHRGVYSFEWLKPGAYRVLQLVPYFHRQTLPVAGEENLVDLEPGEVVPNVDFGTVEIRTRRRTVESAPTGHPVSGESPPPVVPRGSWIVATFIQADAACRRKRGEVRRILRVA